MHEWAKKSIFRKKNLIYRIIGVLSPYYLMSISLVIVFSGFLNPYSDPYSRSISNHGLMDQIAGK